MNAIDKKKTMDRKSIKSQLVDSRKELLNLRFQKKSGQLENTSQFRKVRRKIAQLLTNQNKIKGQKNA